MLFFKTRKQARDFAKGTRHVAKSTRVDGKWAVQIMVES